MECPSNPLVLEKRVEFSDTDAAGLIHFTAYFRYMEAAEAALFRGLGLRLLWSEGERSFGFPRVDCQCKFRRPVTFEDPVRIELRITGIQENRIHYTFTFSGPGGTRCAAGSMVTAFVCRGADGRLQSVPLPETHRKGLLEWKNQAP